MHAMQSGTDGQPIIIIYVCAQFSYVDNSLIILVVCVVKASILACTGDMGVDYI